MTTSTVRATEIISGAKAIAACFGVHENTVKAWRRAGAPIANVGGYKADKWELWLWLKERGSSPENDHS